MSPSSDTYLPSRYGVSAFAAVILLGLYVSSRYNFLLFHSLVEIFGVIVAFVIFILAWNTRHVQDNQYLLFLGVASLFTGALELVHAFAYKGLGVFPGHDANLPTQLWIAFRALFSLSFLFAPFFITRTLNVARMFAVYVVVTSLLFGTIFLGIFPDCFVEGRGSTPFKVISEYVIILIFLASLGLLLLKRDAFDRGVLRLMIFSILCSIASELSSTRYAGVYGFANLAKHLFLLLSVYLIYRAIIVTGVVKPTTILFRNLKLSEEALHKAHDEMEHRVRERTEELARANEELEEEISERKQAEARLVRLATAVESAAEAIVITDTRGHIQYVNPAFEQITGYTKNEAVGSDLHILDSGKQDEAFYRKLRETLEQDGVWSGQLVNKKKDGTLYYEDCTYSPVKDASGAVINFVSIKRDVTEKLRLESIAESVSTLESIGSVFSGVRHEIGNPINSMNAVLVLLKSKMDTLPADKIRAYLDRMTEQIARVEYILRSLKTFNLYETQELQNVQVSSFMKNFLHLVREDFAKKGIALESETDPAAEWAYADPRALQQVLLNVLANAADAVNGRGNPKVSLNVFRLSGMVRIVVQDNGCGIPEDKLRDIYKPFYTTKEHGTGLGLVIVKKMLARMNGSIYIGSRKDVGTVVDISIPAGREEGERTHGTHEGQ